MAYISVVLGVFITYMCYVNGQCPSSKQVKSKCVSVYSCPELMALVTKQDRTPQETDALKKSQCGYDGNKPMVCCPEQCRTPEGVPGRCVSLFSCPHLVDLLRNKPVPPENMQYVANSKCNGPDKYSVCCGDSELTAASVSQKTCAATLTAFPPDSGTKCCGTEVSYGNKIVGGNETAIDQYPWLALIEYTKKGVIKTMCGGALISNRYVLTAAHCLTGTILEYGTPVYVRLSEYDTTHDGPDCMKVEGMGQDCNDGTVILPIEEIITHPDYNRPPRKNDIGLIRLAAPAPYTDFIRPICLPTRDWTSTPPLNFTLFVAGWGAISESKRFNEIKLYVDVPFVDQKSCQVPYSRAALRHTLSPQQVCAGGVKGKDSCKGDSGGPLMYENGRIYETIGVTSFGHEHCGTEDVPGVYTKVWAYDSWIRSNIRA